MIQDIHQQHKLDHHLRLLDGGAVNLEGFQYFPIYQWCIEQLKEYIYFHYMYYSILP